MGNKLYYQDSYIKTFSTKLKKQDIDEDGRLFVVLEDTAFYPTGGGQPNDWGTLNDVPVSNVEEIDGEIRHYLDFSTSSFSENIYGQLDWYRRFDHMQQHAGQHILSAAFEELFNYSTVSFHLGQEFLTIDLDLEELSELEIIEAERRANSIILENRPIETKWVSEEELSQYSLRKKLTVSENIRLVIIPDFDYNGCGGTHPDSTGQVGAIKILDWEKQKKKVRIQFVCGNRVLNQLHKKQKIILELTKLLNAPEQGMVESLTKILENAKNIDKQLDDAGNTLIQYEVKEMINDKAFINDKALISKVLYNRSMKDLQKLARTIINVSENEVIVFLVSENNGSQLQIVAARGAETKVSMKNLLSNILPSINGKGGGNDAFAQGGGEAIVTGNQLLDNAFSIIADS